MTVTVDVHLHRGVKEWFFYYNTDPDKYNLAGVSGFFPVCTEEYPTADWKPELTLLTRLMTMKTTFSLFCLLLLAVACSPTEQTEPSVSLAEAYDGIFLMGAALNNSVFSESDSAAVAIVLQHFNSVTPENVMKPGPMNPQPGVYNFGPADQYVDFAEANNMHVHGHTLVWHNQTPDWFFTDEDGNPNTKEAQIERMRSHIETVAGRYAGRIDSWDVVNEVVHEDGSYRPTNWNEIVGGDDVVRNAFRFAAEYDPNAELYYNDFNAWRPEKRDGIMRLVRMLQAEGIKIDGVGMQGHWGLDYPKNEYIEAAIDSFASLGVKVSITELDIDVLPVSRHGQLISGVMNNYQYQLEEWEEYLDPYKEGLPDEIQQELTDRYEELFEIFYNKRDKLDRVTFWGVHDAMSWKNNSPVQGRTNYPLLFDRSREAKPAVEAVIGVPGSM